MKIPNSILQTQPQITFTSLPAPWKPPPSTELDDQDEEDMLKPGSLESASHEKTHWADVSVKEMDYSQNTLPALDELQMSQNPENVKLRQIFVNVLSKTLSSQNEV